MYLLPLCLSFWVAAKTANSRAQGLAEATSPNIAMQSDCVSLSGYRHNFQMTVKTVKGPSKACVRKHLGFGCGPRGHPG